jgi:hypothetical protein
MGGGGSSSMAMNMPSANMSMAMSMQSETSCTPSKRKPRAATSGAGYLGVHGTAGKYRARIYYNGKQHYLVT